MVAPERCQVSLQTSSISGVEASRAPWLPGDHHVTPLEVREDAVERGGFLFGAHLHLFFLWLRRFLDLLVLQFLQLQPHSPQNVADDFFL
jgi:hypothetical protein